MEQVNVSTQTKRKLVRSLLTEGYDSSADDEVLTRFIVPRLHSFVPARHVAFELVAHMSDEYRTVTE